MARSNFVGNDTDRLELTGGDYIIVKRELNLEEERRIHVRMIKESVVGEKPKLDLEQVGIAEALEYVVEWGGPGFQDENGRAVAFSATTLKNIRSAKFNEITQALDAHKRIQEALRTAEKNGPDGESKLLTISSSAA